MTVLKMLYQVDLRVLLWCRKSRYYPQFIAFVRSLSKTGDGYMQCLFPLVYWGYNPDSGQTFFLLACLTFAFERPIYFLLKNILKRRRPPEVVPDFFSLVKAADQFSFPSGHTMAAFALAGLATVHIGSAAVPLYLWAICIGISRVVLGVHFPSDIIAGALLGSLIVIGVIL
ncbi:phosphatase PAP2 family protein [Thalassotalea sp. 1_MG-2023]|uniref:phosphatase PAP2 family protein n=1 Tax=Thalassotalea sp. 1_MG-2023 TaxID=3062680 RepID=UPI0026E40250|nr:phosphatase PAP2 family protein [Thalassotalea sp. 1_MG-2023]MDO6428767.1 phosphatase PAP2 family protein [Thalassotalea sp. 1_MG-2023]